MNAWVEEEVIGLTHSQVVLSGLPSSSASELKYFSTIDFIWLT
jgi:hypothetical protein